MKYENCERCDGTGSFITHEVHELGGVTEQITTCGMCLGKGKVEVVTKTKKVLDKIRSINKLPNFIEECEILYTVVWICIYIAALSMFSFAISLWFMN